MPKAQREQHHPETDVSDVIYCSLQGFPGVSADKEYACKVGDLVQSLGWEDPLEKEMATHSNILAWRIPWTV